jgi:hypothetical protein
MPIAHPYKYSAFLKIANIGPADYNYEETISTLRYASRAKCIQNVARINQDPKDALLRRFQDEIEQLRRQLAETGGFFLIIDFIQFFRAKRRNPLKTLPCFSFRAVPKSKISDIREDEERRGGNDFFPRARISIILLDQNISDVENETDGGSGAETDDEKQQHQQQFKKLEKKKGETTKAKLDLDGRPSNSSKEVRHIPIGKGTNIFSA